MRHPADGVLRRFVDEPEAVPDADRRHLAGCAACDATLAEMRADAELVGVALGPVSSAVDGAAAWRRVASAVSAPPRRPSAVHPRPPRLRAVRRPVVAGAVVCAVLVGAGTAAANGWFEIFRAERVEPVRFRLDDLNALPELDAYGEFTAVGEPDLRPVDDVSAAEDATGLDAPEVANLPRGVSGEPDVRVAGEVTATFELSVEEAARAAAEAGADLPPPPAGLDGAQVRFVAGPGVLQVWRQRAGIPALIVGRAVAPTAMSTSPLAFDEVRDYLLALPGLPDDVADPLRTFNADGSTLPLPVPTDRFDARTVEVGGATATLLETHDRTLAAVVWVDDGELTVVAGSLDAGEVLAVARELR